MVAGKIEDGAALQAGYGVRLRARAKALTGHTSGLAPGFIQANIVILPERYAADFATFCARNPQACPVLGVSQPGDPAIPAIAHDLDMRLDLPAYRVFTQGQAPRIMHDVAAVWQDDLVTFALGCSFTFEQALISGGIPLRHVAEGRNVAMFRTNRPTVPAGPFGGPLVVSMRPIPQGDIARATAITAAFPEAHGAPVHAGDPAALGIADPQQPDYGDKVDIAPGEAPVFWACGVTSQVAVEQAGIPFFIAHAPGAMLVTDLPHPAYA